MIHLSADIEELARQLAIAKGVSLDDAVKLAIEESARSAGLPRPNQWRNRSPEAVAARKARMGRIADEIAAMPVLDPRCPREIMDDLNAP